MDLAPGMVAQQGESCLAVNSPGVCVRFSRGVAGYPPSAPRSQRRRRYSGGPATRDGWLDTFGQARRVSPSLETLDSPRRWLSCG